ncbi:MAG: DNA-directed RNA polymerase subunit beta [Planctomycetes bacterium]|nr:DNA-directed RNA polymerase subunit beta [Planctomycetota bacterium]
MSTKINGVVDFSDSVKQLPIKELALLNRRAYEKFLQKDVLVEKRKNTGLEKLLQNTFPVKNYNGDVMIEYINYELAQPRYSPDECRLMGISYAAAWRINFRLHIRGRTVEESVYFGDIPLILGSGYFVVNGVDRAIVSQLHRAPGIDFTEERIGDRKLHVFTIIPEVGSWIEVEVGKRDFLTVKIDQGAKFPFTTLLKAVDESISTNAKIVKMFYKTVNIKVDQESELENKVIVDDVKDPSSDKVLIEGLTSLSAEHIRKLKELKYKSVEIIESVSDPLILNTLKQDETKNADEALVYLYKRFRPGAPYSKEKSVTLIHEKFFDPTRYNLAPVGRFRINRKLGTSVAESQVVLTINDLIDAVKYLIDLRINKGEIDDIDDLSNRRIRLIDELLAEDLRKSFYKLKRGLEDRVEQELPEEITPKLLINSRIIMSGFEYFFQRGELSQVVDQTNPLAQLSHERRLSALGPGGLNRRRADFEVRDVHLSHYGRICPIETPEGANIGLIVSPTTCSSIDKYGFLITPYRKVVNGKLTDDIIWMRADEESDKIIASTDTEVDQNGKIKGSIILARHKKELVTTKTSEVHFIDITPFQMLSIAAGLIPFFQHDDANRALMGSNMQRQAVPILKPEKPLVGTGLERIIVESSSMVVKANRDGVVKYADAKTIVTEDEDGEADSYTLRKFEGLNDKSCMNQKPCVKEGDKVKKGQVIAYGPATVDNELALGRNLLVALMTWEGYNFEDAIVINERLVKDDLLTSIHIEEFEVETRETRIGKEEITRDIPNVPESLLSKLDEWGCVKVGTHVIPGDILVGKVVPIGRAELTPEEKLLHAIFGFSGQDVKNESLRVPPGIEGVVLDVKRFSRKLAWTPQEKIKIRKETGEIDKDYTKRMNDSIRKAIDKLNKIVGRKIIKEFNYGPKGSIKNVKQLKEKLNSYISEIKGKSQLDDAINVLKDLFERVEDLENAKEKLIGRLTRGVELPTGVLEKVKVFVSMRHHIMVGDKLSGRHGNKGVIAKILPEEDMPFLADGTSVDIILNPLGVPSRMNLGQLLETHLGYALQKLGLRCYIPPFTPDSIKIVEKYLAEAGLPLDGKVALFDGRTGESFREKVCVGYMYIMKLHHLVADKIHARATGPYSLITQQPLGGRARAGGQRVGEMEVWALESYGAAHTLQEMLTVKSDDVFGRNAMYESIIKNRNILEPSTPASFDVLVNELRGLCLSVKLEKSKQK